MPTRKGKAKGIDQIRIKKSEIPPPTAVMQVNYMFYLNYKKEVVDSGGSKTVYNLWGEARHHTKKVILESEKIRLTIGEINANFPTRSHIYNQCAYYYRAFSKCQIFPDANHRTGYFCIRKILNDKGLRITVEHEEIVQISESIRGKQYIESGDIAVTLKEKDEVYKDLVDWFSQVLKF